ncbi:MFS transporter [Sphingomonas quercus]|nr:MFS transporter [Sphingomonas quercus]
MPRRDRMVIAAASLGTVFEWYDFFVYGTLAALIGRLYFPVGSETAQFLLALATFGIGFGVRPIGAALFGYLGDRLGRKYTFLVTITIMGLATAGVGLVPTYGQIGIAAPLALIVLRVLQGLALGGEYGGAAIYVAENAPRNRRGYYTSFIQASVGGGFLLSLLVVLSAEYLVPPEYWDGIGWRLPFLFSLLLLALSLFMRMRMEESPVFMKLKARQELCHNPLKESFTTPGNIRRILVALFGVSAGLTVIWYTAQFQTMYFLQNALRVDDTAVRIIVGLGAILSLGWFILFGRLSDTYGRKPVMMIGYAATLVLIFPLFHVMAALANPAQAEAARRAPVLVSGPNCAYNPFARAGQNSECAQIIDHLSRKGIAYSKAITPGVALVVGGRPILDRSPEAIDRALTEHGHSTETVVPSIRAAAGLVLVVVALGFLSAMTYGPAAAALVEMFPTRIRYSSLSIPYHIGSGYFGGFLPFISQYIVARTGNPFSGVWYTFAVVALALAVTIVGYRETAGRELD